MSRPSFFSFLFSVTRPFATYVLGLLGIALGWSLIINTQPYLIKLIIDRVTSAKGEELFQQISPLILSYIVVGSGFIVLFRYYDYIIASFIPKQKEFIALTIMQRMMSHSAAFYQRHFVGNLANKINDVTTYTPELIKIMTDNFATSFCTLIIVLYNVAMVHPKFAWGLISWLILFMGGSLYLLFSHSRLVDAAAESRSQVIGYIVDMLVNISSIRLFNRARYEGQQMKGVTSCAARREKNRDEFFMKLHLFQGLSFWAFEALCFWWLLSGIVNQTITPGGFVLVFTLNLQILDQFWDLGSEIREFWEKMGYLQQALRVIYSPTELQLQEKREITLKVTEGRIVFDKVHFFYEGSKPLFTDKTFEIPGGQKVGVVGPSGSGKTTLISLILGIHNVTSGRILIDGFDIQQVTRESLHEAISVIPQDCHLFNRSLMENIRYGRLEATDEEVYEAAEKAQIHDVIENLPSGYNTLAGEKGMRLSGGQRQRIVIARALLKNPKILVLDEATSHLDAVTEEKLRGVFEKLMEGKTVLVIAHQLRTLKNMDRLLVFNKGRIVQDGSHEALINQEGLYRELWRSQSSDGLISHSSAQHAF